MGNVGYLAIRLLLWVFGFFISLFPTLIEIKSPSAWPGQFAAQANAAGLFRDLFFVVVPTASLSLATVVDALLNHFPNSSRDFRETVIVLLLLNISALAVGFIGFLLIHNSHKALAYEPFNRYFWFLAVAVGISLVTEIVMAIAVRSRA